MLGSARSSQKSKQPLKRGTDDDYLGSSERAGINSFRVESQRRSHRVEESHIIGLIYENEKYKGEGSSRSKGYIHDDPKTHIF